MAPEKPRWEHPQPDNSLGSIRGRQAASLSAMLSVPRNKTSFHLLNEANRSSFQAEELQEPKGSAAENIP